MSIAEYIANLNRIKDEALANWSNLSPIEKEVFENSFDWLVDNLDIKRGTVNVTDDLTSQMNDFVQVVVDIVNKSKGYESKVSGFLGDLDTIQENNKKFHGSFNNFDINTAGVKNVQRTVVEEIINQYTDNGLNPNFAAPLRDGIFRNLLAGANMKDIRQYLQNYILGGEDQSGKLHQYLNQTAQQAVDSYTGMINQQLNKDFKFTGYIISGSLIETSSQQCIYAIEHAHDPGGYLSFTEWNQVLDIARNNKKAKLIEGTTVINLPINKLHWGCRHDFTPVIVKPKEEPKPKKEPKKKAEPKPQPTAQQAAAKSFYKVAKSKDEAKQVVKDMFTNYTGLNIGNVSVSSDIDTARMNRINAKLNELMNKFNLLEAAKGGPKPIDVTFKSVVSDRGITYGVVHHYYDEFRPSLPANGKIAKMNFGDKVSDTRIVPMTDEQAPFRHASRVDPENLEFSTIVHEFGHVLSIPEHAILPGAEQKVKDFWKAMEELKREYNAERKGLLDQIAKFKPSATNIPTAEEVEAFKKAKADYADIFIGQYANMNVAELMCEGFTEYQLRATPSKYAKKIGLLIDQYFGK